MVGHLNRNLTALEVKLVDNLIVVRVEDLLGVLSRLLHCIINVEINFEKHQYKSNNQNQFILL